MASSGSDERDERSERGERAELTESPDKEPCGAIVFDASSGISLEEQKEIVAELNAISGGGPGSRIVPDAPDQEAKKKGILFPFIINMAALLILIAGFLFLANIHNKDVELIRRNTAIPGQTEQMMIQEIRLETSRQISEIENQMNEILLKLADVDSEMQQEYRQTLFILEEERARLLEQLLVTEELRRLSSEQEQIARIEDQMNGFYSVLNNQINFALLDEAMGTVNTMREFLAAPFFQQLPFESRRLTHLAVIGALEEAVGLLMEDPSAGRSMAQEELISELMTRNAALEQNIAALNIQGSEYQSLINLLETEQERQVNELNSTIAASNAQNTELQRQNTELQNQIEAIRALLTE